MTDETQIIEKPATETTPVPTAQQTTTTSTEVKTVEVGKLKPENSVLFNVSMRGWITFVLVLGLISVVIINIVTGKVPEANLLAGFISTVSLCVGIYFGQGIKPKSQS